MNKELAKELLPLVNQRDAMGELQKYVDYRISELHRLLEGVRDINQILEYQGSLAELRKMQKLRDTVINTSKG